MHHGHLYWAGLALARRRGVFMVLLLAPLCTDEMIKLLRLLLGHRVNELSCALSQPIDKEWGWHFADACRFPSCGRRCALILLRSRRTRNSSRTCARLSGLLACCRVWPGMSFCVGCHPIHDWHSNERYLFLACSLLSFQSSMLQLQAPGPPCITNQWFCSHTFSS